jgi:hypothetical protein
MKSRSRRRVAEKCGQPIFAGTRASDKVAPIPAVRGTEIERQSSTSTSRLSSAGAVPLPTIRNTLLAALNACMIVGYTALCALQGITLQSWRSRPKAISTCGVSLASAGGKRQLGVIGPIASQIGSERDKWGPLGVIGTSG